MHHWLTILSILYMLVPSGSQAQHIRKSSSPKEIKQFLKNANADRIIFCEVHNDIYQLRDKKTKQWGMHDWFNQLIPTEYDTIYPFLPFQPFTLAKKQGQTVLLKWPYDKGENEDAEISLAEFDELKIASTNKAHNYYLLASQKGKWGCVDWHTKNIIVAFEYSTPQEVPLPQSIPDTSQ